MPEVINLSAKITEQLPQELVDFMQLAGEVAQRQEQKLYLVGGVVRDLLLERANFDLDLVLEGDAIKLAQELAERKQGKITPHPRFGTAKLQWDNWSVDLTTARSETYPKPCVLPSRRSRPRHSGTSASSRRRRSGLHPGGNPRQAWW